MSLEMADSGILEASEYTGKGLMSFAIAVRTKTRHLTFQVKNIL
jgi:hypothetical protein